MTERKKFKDLTPQEKIDFVMKIAIPMDEIAKKDKKILETGTKCKILKRGNENTYLDITTNEEISPLEYKKRYYKFINKVFKDNDLNFQI